MDRADPPIAGQGEIDSLISRLNEALECCELPVFETLIDTPLPSSDTAFLQRVYSFLVRRGATPNAATPPQPPTEDISALDEHLFEPRPDQIDSGALGMDERSSVAPEIDLVKVVEEPQPVAAAEMTAACGPTFAAPPMSEREPRISASGTLAQFAKEPAAPPKLKPWVPEPFDKPSPPRPAVTTAPEPVATPSEISDPTPAEAQHRAPPPPPPTAPTPQPPPPKLVRLKPGTVGSPYAAPLGVPELAGGQPFSVEGLDPRLGLTLDPATAGVSGLPTEAGEFSFTVYGPPSDPAGRRLLVRCELLVNPDPRSLWKTLEPPADAPFPKPHEATLRMDGGGFLVIGASKRGRSHAHEAKFREDAIGGRFLPRGGWRLAVVCDGAGSAKLSRLGSEIAVAVSLETLSEALADLDETAFIALARRLAQDRTDPQVNSDMAKLLHRTLVTAGHDAALALESKAAEIGAQVRDLSTTLILTMTRPVPEGVFTAAFSIGDGGAALLRQDVDYLKTLTLPDAGEFAGQTRFLALSEFDDKITTRLRADVQPDFSCVLLMSDGITDPRLPTEAAFADVGKWRALWDELQQSVRFSRDNPAAERELLAWLDFWSQGNHDDRSLIVIVPDRVS